MPFEHRPRSRRRPPRPCSAVLLAAALAAPRALPVVAQQPAGFFTITPCRLYDSRAGQGPLVGGFERLVPVGSHCGIPPDAVAATLNITAVAPSTQGTLAAYPSGVTPTNTTVVGFSAGVTRAGMAVLATGANGQISARLSGSLSAQSHLVVDASGYFRPVASVQQWQPWEQTITSTRDYTDNGGDPYGGLELDVRFTRPATGDAFVQSAFWDDDPAAPRIFKVRTALPAGTWVWQIESCSFAGADCLADGWNPSQGTFFVQSNTASGNPLWDRGFPTQSETLVGGETFQLSEFHYPDRQRFQWLADTAWTAPPREFDPPGAGSAQTNAWSAFVQDRKARGFTAVQVAPAMAWQPQPGDWWVANPLPLAPGFSFQACTASTLAECYRPTKAYWEHLESIVPGPTSRVWSSPSSA